MKNQVYLLFALFFLCTISTLSAQENINPEWKRNGDIQFGVSIGSTSSVLTLVSDDTNPNPSEDQSAYIIGARVDYFFNKNWSLKFMPS